MKSAKTLLVSVIFLMTASLTACHQKTKVEKEVIVGPEGSVSQETTVDREVTTEIKDDDVKVETKIDLE